MIQPDTIKSKAASLINLDRASHDSNIASVHCVESPTNVNTPTHLVQ